MQGHRGNEPLASSSLGWGGRGESGGGWEGGSQEAEAQAWRGADGEEMGEEFQAGPRFPGGDGNGEAVSEFWTHGVRGPGGGVQQVCLEGLELRVSTGSQGLMGTSQLYDPQLGGCTRPLGKDRGSGCGASRSWAAPGFGLQPALWSPSSSAPSSGNGGKSSSGLV